MKTIVNDRRSIVSYKEGILHLNVSLDPFKGKYPPFWHFRAKTGKYTRKGRDGASYCDVFLGGHAAFS